MHTAIQAVMIDRNSIQLSTSSGSRLADDALQELIRIFEMRFPGRIRAYYAEGSYADRTAITASDIDLVLIFKDRFIDEDEASAAAVENHFIQVFKEFVLSELCGDNLEARQDATWLLGQIPYHDDAITHALQEKNASAIQENIL